MTAAAGAPLPRVAIPGSLTARELRGYFPVARYLLVRRIGGSIDIRRRDENATLRNVGVAVIFRNA